MKQEIESFISQTPDEVISLISKAVKYGFDVYCVGGAIRDFLSVKTYSLDLDFEFHFDLKENRNSTYSLEHFLKGLHWKYEKLSFGVFRLFILDYTIEIGSPREEIYDETNNGIWGHRDFRVSIFSQLPIDKAFKRRDFTINALAIKFIGNTQELCDPLNGIDHLTQRELVPCGTDFSKDPVRFLRAIRFNVRDGFKFSDQLNLALSEFNLEKLTSFYFFNEAIKSKNSQRFFDQFYSLINQYDIEVPQWVRKLAFLTNFPSGTVQRPADFFYNSILMASEEELIFLSTIIQIKKQKLKIILSIRNIMTSVCDEDDKKESIGKIRGIERLLDEIYLSDPLLSFWKDLKSRKI